MYRVYGSTPQTEGSTMTEYALAPNSKFDVANSPYRTPRVMLEQGLLAAYRVRSNGTMRHLDLAPVGSTLRDTAEWVSDRVEMDGASVQAVARELHVSTATVRRYLESLELTEEIESDEWEDLHFDDQGLPVFTTAFGEDEEAAEELAGDTTPCCAAELLGSAIHEPTCANYVPVQPVAPQRPAPARTRRTRTPRSAEEIVRGQGLPWPTDEERAAALAETTANLRKAGAPEPERTAQAALADPVVERRVVRARQRAAAPTQGLAATVTAGAARNAAEATTAPAGRDLAVCYCGGKGAHTPGATDCVNLPPARRVRSHG